MIDVSLASKRSKGFRLGPLDLELSTGRILAVLGSNGAGKSTLFSVMAGDCRPDTGRITATRPIELVRQSVSLPPGVRLDALLTYVAGLRGVPRNLIKKRVDEALDLVDMAAKRNSKSHQLSGGEHRRLLIALGLVSHPGIVLLDEPSAGLDLDQRSKLRETVAALAKVSAVAISTHIVEDVAGLATDVLHIREGQTVFSGTSEDYLDVVPLELQGGDRWAAAFALRNQLVVAA